MKSKIESFLSCLIGLPLWSIGRAGDIEWFAFGNERREVPGRDNVTKIVSEYSLHVQCAWRIRNQDKIIVASRDRFYPPGNDPLSNLEEFEWDTPGGNRLDELISKLLEERSLNPFIVISVRADTVGGVNINLIEGYRLEIFPDDSLSSEYWRFFKPFSEQEHFIITGHGVELE
jgi:hypothetical protein